MKTLLSIALGVSLFCLLASNGMAADEAKPALFTIVSAQYGAGDEWSDVSDKVKAAVQNDALVIDPANSNFGAPIGGTKKSLKVVVKYKGKEVAFQTGIDGIAGNYVVFRNQTAGEFAIFPHCTSPSRIAINGIQIVAGERAISINFTALGDASAVLGSADVAGVIPRANWNNIQYNGNTYGFNPKDDTGTTLESTYVNCRLNTAYPGNHGYTCTVGDDRLMKYFCGNDEGTDSERLPLIRVSGLPASFLANGYGIYVYSDSDFNNNSDPHLIDLGTSLLDTNNQSAGISTIATATIVDSDNWPGSGGGTFTEGATLIINKAVLDAKVGGGVPVAGAVLWIDASTLSAGSYDASTTPVSNLGSQGGTFSAGTYGVTASAIGGKTTLTFEDGNSQYLKSTNAYTNTGNTMTMFIVEQRFSVSNSHLGSICSIFPGTKDWDDIRNWTYNNNGDATKMVIQRTSEIVNLTNPSVGDNFIATVKFDGAKCTHYLKHASGTTTAESAKSGNFGCTQTVIGARQSGDAGAIREYNDLHVGEVLIYNSALSDTDRRAVENYLAAKWGIGTGIGRPKQGGVLNTRRDPPPAALAQSGDPAKDILQLTGGARTKIVWSRSVSGDHNRLGVNYSIMILDTSEGRERVLAEQSHCRIPYITPLGNRVILDDMMSETSDQKRIYVMDMNGNKKELCPAFCAMGVAEDPPGTEWAYYADAIFNANPRGRLWRVQIDNPTVKELVWDKTSICWQWAFTRDGKVAAGALPWPGAHIANLPNGDYQQVHDSGCQVALAPSGKRMLHCTAMQFGVEHGGISVHTAPWGGSDVEINLGDAPGVNNKTLLWPFWAMYDERFFVISGPHNTPRPRNILFAQFNEAFNGIATWVQVTQCPEGFNDCNASCWIQSGSDVKDSPKVDPIQTKAAEDRVPAPAAGGWPADRQDLIFLWENRKGAFLAYDRDGKAIPSLILMPRDRARFDHNQGLWPEAGSFPVPDVEKFLGAQKIAALTLEAYLTPEKGNCPSLAEIVSYSAKSDDANLVLGQLGNKLVMTMKGGAKPAKLCALTAGEPVHVIVTYASGKLTCYKNGKLAGVVEKFQGSPANWTEQHLLFGSNWDGKNPWSGHLEGIAIYTRALSPQEAEREHAAFAEKLKSRKPVARIAIQAKLLAKSKAPTFEEIAPYTQGTAAYEYEVEEVVSGPCKEKKIRVVHHTLIDRKMLPVSQWEVGKSYTLELEPRDANPQMDDGIDVPRDDLPIDLDVVRYYDVGPLGKTP